MKILEINSVCGIRSTGRIAIEIAELYQKRGHIVYVAYGREKVPSRYERISKRIGSEFSVRLNGLESRIFDNDGFTARRATRSFLKWAEEYNPDILWLHNLHGYYINVQMLFKWIKTRPNMKVFWLLHDCWSFTGHCSHYCAVNCEKWKTECNRCVQKKEYPKSIIFDNSRVNYNRKKEAFRGVANLVLLTPSRWLANEVKKGFLKDYDVLVRPNRIDTSVFKPTKSNFKERFGIQDKTMILAVAQSWDEKKGFSFLLELSNKLGSMFVIVMIGLSKKQIASLPNTIIGLEKTNNLVELAEIYSAADVFVNPTIEDTFPTVNIEAVACGTPVVTNNTGGSPEVAGNECGRVVYSKTIDEFIEKIQECLCCNYTEDQCRNVGLRFSKQVEREEPFPLE